MFCGCGSDLNLFVVLRFFVAEVRRTSWRSAARRKCSDCGLGQMAFCGLGGDPPVSPAGVGTIED